MAIREITKPELKKAKAGWRWDKKRELWVTWQVETNFDGKRKFQRGFLTEKDAKIYLEAVKTQTHLKEIGVVETIKYPPLAELFDKRLADIENAKEKTRAERIFPKFLDIVGETALISDVAKMHFKAYADLRVTEITDKKAAAQSKKKRLPLEAQIRAARRTANREITLMSKAFSSVSEYYNLEKWRKPEIFKFPNPGEGRQRVIEPDEYAKLFGYFFEPKKQSEEQKTYKARRRTGLILKFALMTGLRHGEICGIQKVKFNRARREVDVYRFKTNRWKMYSPLAPTMIEVLDEAAEIYPDSEYFFSADGRPHFAFYRILERACNKFDIPYGRFQEGGITLHDARHTFSTILHANLIDNKTTTEFTDNPTAVSNYQHSTQEAKVRAMDIIENIFGGGGRLAEEKLREVFEAAAAGQVDFEGFKNMLAKNCGLFA